MADTNRQEALRTGFIGIGNQGGPMAMRMMGAGFPLAVWARRPEVCENFAQEGADIAGSISELGSSCDHIGLCVFSDEDVLEVCETLIPAMQEGSLLAIHSTIHPDTCEALERHCKQGGILFMDAPVSGGALAAAQGELTVMCGGSQAAFDRAMPVLESFGKLIVRLGDAGAGQRAKLLNNTLMSANMGVARAVVAAGKALGIDKAALAEVINQSSGRSLGFQVYAGFDTYADFSVGTAVMVKDVGLLCSLLEGDENSALLKQVADHFLVPAAEVLREQDT